MPNEEDKEMTAEKDKRSPNTLGTEAVGEGLMQVIWFTNEKTKIKYMLHEWNV